MPSKRHGGSLLQTMRVQFLLLKLWLRRQPLLVMSCGLFLVASLSVCYITKNNTIQEAPDSVAWTEAPEAVCTNWVDDLLTVNKELNLMNSTQMMVSSLLGSPQPSLRNPVIVINNGVIQGVDAVLKVFQSLPYGSAYMHRVSTPSDVKVVTRLQQLTQQPIMKYMEHFVEYDIFSQYCTPCGCLSHKQQYDTIKHSDYMKDSEFFKWAQKTPTDKITYHQYHHLYGKHLPKWSHRNQGAFLEIGLGCNMKYGPGASGLIWPQMFDHVFFIEYDEECVTKHSKMIHEAGYEVKVGDQADVVFLEKVKYEITRRVPSFDVIIDDGGHSNRQIITSFLSLWHAVSPKGAYIIEDFAESIYTGIYDVKPKPADFYGEYPGTADWFIGSLLRNLFWEVSGNRISSHDVAYIECTYNHCIIGK